MTRNVKAGTPPMVDVDAVRRWADGLLTDHADAIAANTLTVPDLFDPDGAPTAATEKREKRRRNHRIPTFDPEEPFEVTPPEPWSCPEIPR